MSMKCVKLYSQCSELAISSTSLGCLFPRVFTHNSLGRLRGYFKQLSNNVKYMGMPLFLSSNKSKDLSFVNKKFEARVQGWKGKTLS